jgi:AcrR family transcriptional regulator
MVGGMDAPAPVATPPARKPQQRSRQTRRAILDAAIECLVEDGYAGATTVQIQARAGISRGRLLHHFPSRDDLLVAAVDHLATARCDEVVAAAAGKARPKDRIDVAIEAMWESTNGPLFIAANEIWVAARTHPELRAVLEPAERETGRKIRAAYAEAFGSAAEHPRFPEVFDLLTTSMFGAALFHNFDTLRRRDATRLREWKRLAHELLSG